MAEGGPPVLQTPPVVQAAPAPLVQIPAQPVQPDQLVPPAQPG